MNLTLRIAFIVLASVASVVASSTTASAQFVTGFETPPYVTGPLLTQESWTGGPNSPRVQTAAEIAAELQGAGLNPANPIHSGSQALLMTYTIGETSGGLLRRPFTGLEIENDVVMDVWARPLTPGAGGSTIGFNQGNTFVGIMDEGEIRAAAFRFGVIRDAQSMITGTTIDYASATAGPAVWVPSGLTWEADHWYHFRFDLDYTTKQYDFYIDGTKVNTESILFYSTGSTAATRAFVSRGTNQAGMLLDDISVLPASSVQIQGDYNGNGVVDAADYVIWRNNDGSPGGYTTWRANFGNTSGAGSGQASAAAVPEPGMLMLSMTSVLVTISVTRARRANTIG